MYTCAILCTGAFLLSYFLAGLVFSKVVGRRVNTISYEKRRRTAAATRAVHAWVSVSLVFHFVVIAVYFAGLKRFDPLPSSGVALAVTSVLLASMYALSYSLVFVCWDVSPDPRFQAFVAYLTGCTLLTVFWACVAISSVSRQNFLT